MQFATLGSLHSYMTSGIIVKNESEVPPELETAVLSMLHGIEDGLPSLKVITIGLL